MSTPAQPVSGSSAGGFPQNAPPAPKASGASVTGWTPVDTAASKWTPVGEPGAPGAGAAPAPRTWLDSAKDFAQNLWQQVNPVTAVQGAEQLAAHPIATYMADAAVRQRVMQQAEAAFKNGNYGEGVAHSLYAIVPFLGPNLSSAANKLEGGNYAGGLGQSIGLGMALAGPDAIGDAEIPVPGGDAARAAAERMYQGVLKPAPASYSAGEAAQLVRTGLEEGIPVSKEGVSAIGDLVQDLNDKVQAQIKAGSETGATVNKFAVASRLGDTAQRFANQVNPEADLNAIGEAGNEFLANQPAEIPAADAQRLKSGTYRQLKARSYGELKSATIEAQKALARGIKEELEQQFPEIQGLNAREGKLLGLDEAVQRAVNRGTNHNIWSLGGKIATAGGAGAGGAVGGVGGAELGAVAATALHYVLSDPTVQSKLAIAMYHGSDGAIKIGAAQARVAGYVNALGNAVQNSQAPASAQPGTRPLSSLFHRYE